MMTQREPWGVTLAALSRRATSSRLDITAGEQRVTIQFDHGRVVDASSRAVTDSVLRIALLHKLVQPRQIAELERVLARAEGDEVAALQAALALPDKTAAQVRASLVIHRIARTFAFDAPAIEIRDGRGPVAAFAGVDVRAAIYQGARVHLSDRRLADELGAFGSYFVLQHGACVDAYDLGDEERPVLATLARGATFDELLIAHRVLDQRCLQAIVYALACCGDLVGVAQGRVVTSDFSALAAGTQQGPRPALLDRRVAADAAHLRAHRALSSNQPEVAVAELTRAIELDPETVEYRALLAWARFCAAKDKRAVATEVRNTLTKILRVSNKPELVRFHLGRVERMLGNDREALVHFQAVLALQPRHAEASVEVRFILQRLPALGAARPRL